VKHSYLLIFLIACFLTACNEQGTPTLYIPPTQDDIPAQIIPTTDLVSVTATSPPLPTSTPVCTPGLIFLEDITLPDGTIVSPGEMLDKRWLVENNGSCNWDRRFGLQLIAGPDMGAAAESALFPARSATQIEIRIIFTAPEEPGTYRSAWQAHDSQGNLFGDPIFIEISVNNP
jgi:hypothetical protein